MMSSVASSHFFEDNANFSFLKSGAGRAQFGKRFRMFHPNVVGEGSNDGNRRQASEPAEDLVSMFEAAKPPHESHGIEVDSHQCGNFEHDCPIFQASKSRLMTPKKVYCPFCNLLNDGQCSHFDTRYPGRPALKVCRRCNTFGEHWSNDCPNVVRDGPLPPLMYCRICQSREHRSPQCPNAEASLYEN